MRKTFSDFVFYLFRFPIQFGYVFGFGLIRFGFDFRCWKIEIENIFVCCERETIFVFVYVGKLNTHTYAHTEN